MNFADYLNQQLQLNANPDKAPQMQAYMKTQQPFYGVSAPERKRLFREAKKQFTVASQEQYQTTILSLWQSSHRESQYQALEVAEAYKKFHTPDSMPLYEQLLLQAENWDTVDWIAINLAGRVILNNRKFEDTLVLWRQHENLWMRRSSLIAHIKHKKQTNTDLLSETIAMLSHESEFFIRKAIGWVLREYSKTDPQWVQDFVTQHENQLSGLSRREALKHIERTKLKRNNS